MENNVECANTLSEFDERKQKSKHTRELIPIGCISRQDREEFQVEDPYLVLK
jgi:hypothetical protein